MNRERESRSQSHISRLSRYHENAGGTDRVDRAVFRVQVAASVLLRVLHEDLQSVLFGGAADPARRRRRNKRA